MQILVSLLIQWSRSKPSLLIVNHELHLNQAVMFYMYINVLL